MAALVASPLEVRGPRALGDLIPILS